MKMNVKNLSMILGTILCLLLLTACPGNDAVDTYPDVAGTWDWVVTFTLNECDGGLGYNVVLVITQNGGTGTWTSYDDEDTDFSCPLETGGYTMDTAGNVTIDLQDYDFDPGNCNEYAVVPADATVTIQITASATSTQMTGTHTEYWTSVSWGVTDCQKTGTVIATRR